MADLTLNFADASFNDPNADNDFIIEPGNNIIYEMGSGTPGNRADTGITTGASITGAAFTVGHNQEFMFEFEDDGDANTTDDYKLTVMTQTAAGTVDTPAQYAHDTVTWDVAQTDMDGVTGPDDYLSKTLVDGRSAKVTEVRLDNPHMPGDQSETDVYYVGDGEQAGYTSWVLSGDMNGTSGNDTSGDGSLGFHAGTYGGVFLGGDGTDTLVFEHNNEDDSAQMYVGLDAGFAMFGNGANSPLVQFANIGAQPYELTWERLEMRGDSNDFVVVGGGLQGADSSTAARKLDTTDFFEIDLGSGTDQLYVTDSTQSITLDLSKTGEHTVTANSTGSAFTLDVSGNEMYGGQMGDSMSLSVKGTLDDASGNPMDGVIDYIDFGDGQDNAVINNSDQGLA
ncbi:hypothetical protein OA007_03170, partial [SAR116 cluster bacterium]|nr:hypothetical protein [SAR116 cluster bacterium]